MRQLIIPEAGGPDVFEMRESADPEAGPGEVRIRVSAAGVNFADLSATLADDLRHTGVVVGYTGVENFYGGLELSFSRFGVRDDVPAVDADSTLDTVTASLVLRHYF